MAAPAGEPRRPGFVALGRRSRASVSQRIRRLRAAFLPVVQSSVAAGIAWRMAQFVPGHHLPYFAPIAAVISLGVAVGQQTRRAREIALGVAVGVMVGDLLAAWVGTGSWQIALGVGLAMSGGLLLGGGALVVNQAASSAVLITALTARSGHVTYARFIDSVIGGAVAVIVNSLLIPLNPLTLVRRASAPLFSSIIDEIYALADALEKDDGEMARAALTTLRNTEALIEAFNTAVAAGRETAALSPAHWRRRGQLMDFMEAAVHLDRAVRNLRVLARRAVNLLREGQSTPPALGISLRLTAEGFRALQEELEGERPYDRSRALLLQAAATVAPLLSAQPSLSLTVLVAQIRSIVIDLLRASGVDEEVALAAMQVGHL